MYLRKKTNFLFRFGLITALLAQPIRIYTQGNKIFLGEKGFLPVYNYSTKIYKAAQQNWSVQQDKRGIMYFGNNEGILEYDGVSWRLIKVSNNTNVRSLTIDDKGRIYAGASGEIGFLQPGNSGEMQYRSLCGHIDKKNLDFTDVWSALTTKSAVYFQSDTKIFRWNGKTMRVWNAEKSFHRIFSVDNRVFARQRGVGLMEIKGDSLVLLNGGEAYAEEIIYGMVPFGHNSSDILICTKNNGLHILKLTTHSNQTVSVKSERFVTQADAFLSENIAYHLLATNSLYSIATITNGIIAINAKGNIESFLNKQTGLQDETVYSQFEDASGNLWLATNNGISKTTIHSPVTFFSDKNGLHGSVRDIVRHNNSLFVATNHGSYILNNGFILNKKTTAPVFDNLSSINEECWDLFSFKSNNFSSLLIATNENVISINDQFKKIEILKCNPWKTYQSKYDSSRVFIGLNNGLASIYWEGRRWVEEAVIPEIKESINSIAEDEQGNLWLGHAHGVIKINFLNQRLSARMEYGKNSYSISKYDTIHGLPKEATVKVESMNDHILFGTSNGIYNFTNNTFSLLSSVVSSFSEKARQIHRISYNKNSETIWLETQLTDKKKFEFGYLQKGGDEIYSWNITPFLPYSTEVIHTIYHDENGITWFGGSEGLYRYDSKADENNYKPYNAIIRKVTTGDSAIFSGTFFSSENVSSLTQNQSLKPVLPFSNNSIIFEFSALDFRNEHTQQYQYYLEGFDKSWSGWKNESKAIYTNLPEGNHLFHVKAKNVFNLESAEAIYEFTILPPWYRTWWAYAGYVLLSISFVYGAVTLSTRGLKAIIRERTAEIVQQKEVIEYKNRNITDSINYAKRIQEAILPSKELIRKRFPESFILYRPKDIVAGDFYWFAEKEGKFIAAACDCTGHGVPGAFMSLICYSLLNEVLLEKNFANPASALDTMKNGIIKSLGQTGQEGEQKDGMDMSLITLEVISEGKKVINKLSFAGANNPLYLLRKGELTELNADKMPIGIYLGTESPFTNKEIVLEPGDTFYLFSDGYADQFGGEKGKKFTKKRFKDLLLSFQHESMSRQKDILEQTLDTWLGSLQQIDDVLIMGIRIS